MEEISFLCKTILRGIVGSGKQRSWKAKLRKATSLVFVCGRATGGGRGRRVSVLLRRKAALWRNPPVGFEQLTGYHLVSGHASLATFKVGKHIVLDDKSLSLGPIPIDRITS